MEFITPAGEGRVPVLFSTGLSRRWWAAETLLLAGRQQPQTGRRNLRRGGPKNQRSQARSLAAHDDAQAVSSAPNVLSEVDSPVAPLTVPCTWPACRGWCHRVVQRMNAGHMRISTAFRQGPPSLKRQFKAAGTWRALWSAQPRGGTELGS